MTVQGHPQQSIAGRAVPHTPDECARRLERTFADPPPGLLTGLGGRVAGTEVEAWLGAATFRGRLIQEAHGTSLVGSFAVSDAPATQLRRRLVGLPLVVPLAVLGVAVGASLTAASGYPLVLLPLVLLVLVVAVWLLRTGGLDPDLAKLRHALTAVLLDATQQPLTVYDEYVRPSSVRRQADVTQDVTPRWSASRSGRSVRPPQPA